MKQKKFLITDLMLPDSKLNTNIPTLVNLFILPQAIKEAISVHKPNNLIETYYISPSIYS